MELVEADESQALSRLRRILAYKRSSATPASQEDFLPLLQGSRDFIDGSPPIQLVLGANKVLRLAQRTPQRLSLVAVALFISTEWRTLILSTLQRAGVVAVWGVRKSPLQLGAVIGGALGRSSCMAFALVNPGSSADPIWSVRDFVISRLTLIPGEAAGQESTLAEE